METKTYWKTRKPPEDFADDMLPGQEQPGMVPGLSSAPGEAPGAVAGGGAGGAAAV